MRNPPQLAQSWLAVEVVGGVFIQVQGRPHVLSRWLLLAFPMLQMGNWRPGRFSNSKTGLWHPSHRSTQERCQRALAGGGHRLCLFSPACWGKSTVGTVPRLGHHAPSGQGSQDSTSVPWQDSLGGPFLLWGLGSFIWKCRGGKAQGLQCPRLRSLGPEMTNPPSVEGRRISWPALNPVILSFRTNTMMLLMKSLRPSGECGTCRAGSGLGPGPIPIFQASPPFHQPSPSCGSCQHLGC